MLLYGDIDGCVEEVIILLKRLCLSSASSELSLGNTLTESMALASPIDFLPSMFSFSSFSGFCGSLLAF